MKDCSCPVVFQNSLGRDYYLMGLETGYEGFTPGQFGMLQVPPAEGLILRRPFSFARQEGTVTSILYKVVGKGTEVLRRVGIGDSLRLLGPLGKGFTEPPKGGEVVGVAGGYGVAPFLEMAAQLKKTRGSMRLFYGARSAADILLLREFLELGANLELSTEDGSKGYRGLITNLLEDSYASAVPGRIYVCGPTGLLRAVQRWCQARDVPCELSVEETMGCGTGVCLGCVVANRQGNYLRACKEGPVFQGDEILI